ncbi:hypothetical protein AVEN_69101-1 [Araneus ventricosus]|uniref:Uncharacterized protein n=1 Tax=Araneus ventricosus TaxID=182803 RepID=A0A4Y2HMN4_ARAVE|nr:hypothetical protein AVEN_69101-1 [Araneus ventricosus]
MDLEGLIGRLLVDEFRPKFARNLPQFMFLNHAMLKPTRPLAGIEFVPASRLRKIFYRYSICTNHMEKVISQNNLQQKHIYLVIHMKIPCQVADINVIIED